MAIVGGIAASIFAFLGVTIVLGVVLGDDDTAEDRVNEYLEGTGEREFFAPDGQFRATFPSAPQRTEETANVGGQALKFTFYVSRFENTEFGVAIFNLQPGDSFDLNQAVNGSAAAVNGRVETANLVKFQGLDGVESVISAPDSTFVKSLVVRAPRRVYQVIVSDKTNPPPGYEKFKQSFRIVQQ